MEQKNEFEQLKSSRHSIGKVFPLEIYQVPEQAGAMVYAGQKGAEVLIAVNIAGNEAKDEFFLPDEDRSLLIRILEKGLKLNSGKDVAMANIAQNKNITFKEMLSLFAPKKIVFFDIDPKKIRLHIQKEDYEVLEVSGVKLLFSESLHQMHESEPKKTKLWRALQKMFGIK